MKTAGVVIDFYDDPNGSLLRKAFPTPDDLPEAIKTAHILSSEERDVLRNEAYALVMVNEGRHLRKFACVDQGNTILSTLYFMENWSALPTEAVKVACANLIDACRQYGLPTGSLEKIAANTMARQRDPMAQSPYVSDDADWAQRTNLLSIRGGQDSGRVIPMANTMKTAGIVDVTAKEPDIDFVERNIEKTALDGRYPLDSYADVQHAIRYFADNYVELLPEDRHEYAVKTASRARELGIETDELLDRYGSTEYAYDVDAHLASRRAMADDEWVPVYRELQEKRAMIDPDTFAELLAETDTASGLNWHWGGAVADPYFSTFGGYSEKVAEEWSWQGRVGDHVTAAQLKNLALNGRPLVHKHFSSDMTNAFIADPVTIFKSLPDDTKAILARLANDLGTDGLAGN